MASGPATDLKQGKDANTGRARSTIDFPYFDLDQAVAVAQAVHAVGGTACDWDQLAAQMKQAPSGGGFRIRVMTARTFGLLDYDRGSVTLTELGMKAVDQKYSRAARAEAFLYVPLYKEMYEKLKGAMLPPAAAIERSMEALGVAPKQKDKARQVFVRSAKQAGFFEIDQNRLTYPPNIAQSSNGATEQTKESSVERTGGPGSGGGLPPFIQGLLDKLPPPESDWPVQARAKWLQTASNIFDLMYKTEETANISITVN